MDAEIAALEARRDKTRALKQGMMQELLTGRIQAGMNSQPQPSDVLHRLGCRRLELRQKQQEP